MSQLKKRKRICSTSTFCSIQALSRLDSSWHLGEGRSLLNVLIQTLNLFYKYPNRYTQKHLFYQLSEHPLAQSS